MYVDVPLIAIAIACFLIAIVALFLAILFLVRIDNKDPAESRLRRNLGIVAGVIGLVQMAAAFMLSRYLLTNELDFMKMFALWYLVGLLSRIALLKWRHGISYKVFDLDESYYFPLSAILWALGGLTVTIHLLFEIADDTRAPRGSL